MNCIVVYNDSSGSAVDEPRLRELCEKSDIVVDEYIKIGPRLKSKIARYIDQKATVLVVGGDGTQNLVAGMLVDTGAVLAPLPGGTLNHFAKDLGIDTDLEKAFEQFKKTTVKKVDVGVVNGRIFLNNSSIGLYPSSLSARARFEPRVGKWPAATGALVRSFMKFHAYAVTIENETFRTPFVFVGNNIYKLKGLSLPDRASLSEGRLSVFIAKTKSRMKFIATGWKAVMGRAKDTDEFDMRNITNLEVRAHKKHLLISLDGELLRMNTPLHYKTKPKSLRVRY